MSLYIRLRYLWRLLCWKIVPPPPYVEPLKERVLLIGGAAHGKFVEVVKDSQSIVIPVMPKIKVLGLGSIPKKIEFGKAFYQRSGEVRDATPIFRYTPHE